MEREPTGTEAGAVVVTRATTPHIPGPRLGIDWSSEVSTLASTPLDSGILTVAGEAATAQPPSCAPCSSPSNRCISPQPEGSSRKAAMVVYSKIYLKKEGNLKMSAHASFENLLEFHNLWNFNIFRGLPHYNRQIIIFAKGKMGYLPIPPTFNAVI
jgi:hypothetical protein